MNKNLMQRFLHLFFALFWFIAGIGFLILKYDLLQRYDIEAFLSGIWGSIALYVLGGVSLLFTVYFSIGFIRLYRESRGFIREGKRGKVHISPFAVEEMANEILRNHVNISSYRIKLSHLSEGIGITVKAAVESETDISDLSEKVQKLLKEKIASQTGLTVNKVDFYAQSVKDDSSKEKGDIQKFDAKQGKKEERTRLELDETPKQDQSEKQTEGEDNG